MNVLKKIQSWPKKKKKIFLWIIGLILFLVLLIFWFKIFTNRLINFNQDEFKARYNWPELKLPAELNHELNKATNEFLEDKFLEELERMSEEENTGTINQE
ncbi:MAG: hypothetical protein ACPLW9_00935 [Minisyncoccales bacterium]